MNNLEIFLTDAVAILGKCEMLPMKGGIYEQSYMDVFADCCTCRNDCQRCVNGGDCTSCVNGGKK